METDSTQVELWSHALDELRLQMTRATFETWFTGAHVVDVAGATWTIGVRSDFARDWLEQRLRDAVERTLAAVVGEEISVVFTVARPPQAGPVYHTQADAEPPFPGFEPFQANFVQMPSQFFEVVVPAGPPVVVAFVAAVAYNTIGQIVNYHTGQRAEWWEVSHRDIATFTGMSAGSVPKAVHRAVEAGYVVMATNGNSRKYRLRRLHEPYRPVDNL